MSIPAARWPAPASRRGDVVQSVDGSAVDDMQSLNYRIATHRPGDSVKMHVASGKTARDVTVTLALPPENPPREVTTIAGRNPLTGARGRKSFARRRHRLQMDVMAKGVAIIAVSRQRLSPPITASSPATSCAASTAPTSTASASWRGP